MTDKSKRRLSRINDILNMAKGGKLPAPEPLSSQEESVIIEGLMHSSAELRRRVVEEVNAGEINVISILTKLVAALEKDEFQLFQDKVAALDSLARLDLRGKQGNIPSKSLKALVVVLVQNVMSEDAKDAAAAVQATLGLALQNLVTLQLLEYIETRCKSERVLAPLRGLKALGVATPDITCRLLAVFPHFSPSGLIDIPTGVSQPACLTAALDLLRGFPQACFDDRVLASLESLAQNPRAASTRHYAPKQRVHLIVAALTLIKEKYSAAIAQEQAQQEKASTEAVQRNEARLQAGRPEEAAGEPSERNVLFGNVLSTVQDCLSDPEAPVRRQAAWLICSASVGSVYAKVIAHQLANWLESTDDFQQRCAIGNMIDLLFHPSPITDMCIDLLEREDLRIRKLAALGIHEFLCSTLKADPSESVSDQPFASLFPILRDHISKTFGDLMVSDATNPRVAMFSRLGVRSEKPEVLQAAFDFLRTARCFSHEAVCNAIMALDSEDLSVSLSAAGFLATAGLLATTNDRKPALTALQALLLTVPGAMLESGNVSLKSSVIAAVAALPPTDIVFPEGIDMLVALALDPTPEVRQAAQKNVLVRFMGEADDSALAQRLRRRLVSLVLGRLINGCSPEEKAIALGAAGLTGRSDQTLVDTLATMLECDAAETRIHVFQCLTALRCTRADTVVLSLRFLHNSVIRLRDVACIFAFKAAILAPSGALDSDTHRSIVETAMWLLQNDERSGNEVADVRHAAVALLRHVAALQIRASREATVKLDKLNIKECITGFLRSNTSKRDTLELQRYAWMFLTDFFAIDDTDVALLTESFSSSRNPSAGRARDTYSRALMAEVLPRIIVRTDVDCCSILEVMTTDRLLAFLFAEPILRFAQLPNREIPVEWGRLHSTLKPRVPLLATLLAAEFTVASGCAPVSLPLELRTLPQATPAAQQGSSASTSSAPATAAASASGTPSAAAPPAAAPASAPAPAPVVPEATVQSIKAEAASGNVEALKLAEKRIATLEKACNQQMAQLTELREKLTQSQKALRDERRSRLLADEHKGELEVKVKQLQNKIHKLEELAAQAPARSDAASPTKVASSSSSSSAAAAVLTAPPSAEPPAATPSPRPSAEPAKAESAKAASTPAPATPVAAAAAAAAAAQEPSGGTSTSSARKGWDRPTTSLRLPVVTSPPATDSRSASLRGILNKGGRSGDSDKHATIQSSEDDSGEEETRISQPKEAKSFGMAAAVPAPAPASDDTMRLEVKRLEQERRKQVASMRRKWGDKRSGSIRSILVDGDEVGRCDTRLLMAQDENVDEDEQAERLEQKRLELMHVEKIRVELEKLDAESDEEKEKSKEPPAPVVVEKTNSPQLLRRGSLRGAAAAAAVVTGAPVLTTRRKATDPRQGHIEELLKTEQTFASMLQVLSNYGSALRALEAVAPPSNGIYAIAYLFNLLESLVGLQSQLMKDFNAVMESVPAKPVNYIELGNMYTSKKPFLPIYVRFRAGLLLFLGAVEKFAVSHLNKARSECTRIGKEACEADSELKLFVSKSLEEQFAAPVVHLGKCKAAIEAVLGLTEDPAEAGPLSTAVAVLEQVLRASAATDAGEAGHLEFQRLHGKKFRSTTALFSPTRTFMSKWTFRLMKIKKGDGKDDDRISISEDNIITDARGTSQEARILLFNDAVMVTTHRLGKSVCKHFAELERCEIIRTDPSLCMFGIRIMVDAGETCLVFRGTDQDSVRTFLDAIKLEIDLSVALRARSTIHEESDL